MSSLKKNFLYNVLYQFLVFALPLVTIPYLSRVLGPEKIGEYSYSFSIVSYFTIFVVLGLGNYGNRAVAMARGDACKLSKVFSELYLLQLLCGLVVVSAYVLYSFFLSPNSITWVFLIFLVSSVLDVNWFYYGMEKFKIVVLRNVMVKLLTTILIFVFVKNAADLNLYCFLIASSTFISQLLLWPIVFKLVKPIRPSLKGVLYHAKPNLILFIPVLASSIYKIMDKIMLGSMCDFVQVGYYENVEKILNVPLSLVGALGVVILPRISNLVANNEMTKINDYFRNSTLFVLCLSSFICFSVISVADLFVPFFFGEKFIDAVPLFYFLMPSCVFTAFAGVVRTQFLIPFRYDSVYVQSIVFAAVLNLVFNLVFIKKFGACGVAVGTLLAEVFVCVYQLFRVRTKLNVKECLLDMFFFVFIGVVMCIFIKNISFGGVSQFSSLLLKVLFCFLFFGIGSFSLFRFIFSRKH